MSLSIIALACVLVGVVARTHTGWVRSVAMFTLGAVIAAQVIDLAVTGVHP